MLGSIWASIPLLLGAYRAAHHLSNPSGADIVHESFLVLFWSLVISGWPQSLTASLRSQVRPCISFHRGSRFSGPAAFEEFSRAPCSASVSLHLVIPPTRAVLHPDPVGTLSCCSVSILGISPVVPFAALSSKSRRHDPPNPLFLHLHPPAAFLHPQTFPQPQIEYPFPCNIIPQPQIVFSRPAIILIWDD